MRLNYPTSALVAADRKPLTIKTLPPPPPSMPDGFQMHELYSKVVQEAAARADRSLMSPKVAGKTMFFHGIRVTKYDHQLANVSIIKATQMNREVVSLFIFLL